jgi:Tfp pilus assembly protein PilP
MALYTHLEKNSKRLFVLIFMAFTLIACDPHSSSITHYIQDAANAPAQPIMQKPMPHFIDYQPYVYNLDSTLSPFGLREQSGKNIVSLLQSFPLNQIKMVGMIYFQRESWGLVSFPNGKIDRVKKGMSLGAEGGKVVGVTIDKIIIEDSLSSSLKVSTAGGTGMIRRTELRLS